EQVPGYPPECTWTCFDGDLLLAGLPLQFRHRFELLFEQPHEPGSPEHIRTDAFHALVVWRAEQSPHLAVLPRRLLRARCALPAVWELSEGLQSNTVAPKVLSS